MSLFSFTDAVLRWLTNGGTTDPATTPPSVTGGGGSGGGAVTIANGADVAQGNTADNASANTVMGRLTAIKAALGFGQKTMSASLPVTVASDQTAVPVSGTFFQATQPVSGTVTAQQAATDASAWTASTTAFAPSGGVFNDSAAALTSGQQGTERLTPNRALHANLRNQAGTELGTASNPLKVDDTVAGTYPNAPTNIPAAISDTALLAANANRRGAIVSNDGTGKLYVLLDQSGLGAASSTNFTYVVAPGGTLELPRPMFTGRIRGIWSAPGGSATVTEIT